MTLISPTLVMPFEDFISKQNGAGQDLEVDEHIPPFIDTRREGPNEERKNGMYQVTPLIKKGPKTAN